MGNGGYWILIADSWGIGLNMINPRLLEQHGQNWWTCNDDTTDNEIWDKHKLDDYPIVQIVRENAAKRTNN